jgi:hypothetical protein
MNCEGVLTKQLGGGREKFKTTNWQVDLVSQQNVHMGCPKIRGFCSFGGILYFMKV